MKYQFLSLITILTAGLLFILPTAYAAPVEQEVQVIDTEELRTQLQNSLENMEAVAVGLNMTEEIPATALRRRRFGQGP